MTSLAWSQHLRSLLLPSQATCLDTFGSDAGHAEWFGHATSLLFGSMRTLKHVILALTWILPASSSSYHSETGILQYVNPKIGTFGYSPNGNGGMIPSVSPPFGMTRWTPQTRENFISQCPYHDVDEYIHGFQATHQPAIWMGESGQVVLSPGLGDVEPLFERRGLRFQKYNEMSTPYVYEVTLNAERTGVQGVNLTESLWSPVPGGAQSVPEDIENGTNGRTRRALAWPSEPTGSAHAYSHIKVKHWGSPPTGGSERVIRVVLARSMAMSRLTGSLGSFKCKLACWPLVARFCI